MWRKKNTINEELKEYINEVIFNKLNLHDHFVDVILSITSRTGHYFNSDFLHKWLIKVEMADRDGAWTKLIHNQYSGNVNEVTSIRRLIDWAWTEDKRENISDESIRLICQTMFWFLTSTNRTLRDSATKAIICLLEERISVLITLIKIFKDVNDRYVLQRLYAVAYGCALRTSDILSLKELSNCVFETVFNTEHVTTDILLRDYSRGVIEFAIIKGHKFDFELDKIRPPYKSELPKAFPSDEDINEYRKIFKSERFGDKNWGVNTIISSMVTNSGGAFYGDFGRYVFENAFANWKLDVQDLSNLAVKWIIEEYGYDVEKHGNFDSNIKENEYDRYYVKKERIGKKYQWIAFYDLLARVSDNYPMFENWYSRNPKVVKYEGTWNPYVRDIDPTIIIKGGLENKFEKFWWNPVNYSNWQMSNKDWVKEKEDLPNPIDMISVFDKEGTEWLVLQVLTSWKEPANIGEDSWQSPRKDLWYHIRSYLTKKSEHNKILKWAKGKSFMGRWMPESTSRYELFSREYYWSSACETFRKEDYGEYTWSSIDNNKTGRHIGSIAVTAVDYLWEEEFDSSKESTISFYKPTEILFNILELNYSKIEGELINKDGDMICFDPSTTKPTHSCLVVKKKELLEKLKENDLDIFWTVLGEKLVIGGELTNIDDFSRLEISGLVHYDREKLKYIPNFTNK